MSKEPICLEQLHRGLELALGRAELRIMLSGMQVNPHDALLAGQIDFCQAAQNLAIFSRVVRKLPAVEAGIATPDLESAFSNLRDRCN